MRLYFGASFLLYAAIVILTFSYFIPRDLIIFTWSIPDHLEEIKTAVSQWSQMNWLRTVLGLGAFCARSKVSTLFTKPECEASESAK